MPYFPWRFQNFLPTAAMECAPSPRTFPHKSGHRPLILGPFLRRSKALSSQAAAGRGLRWSPDLFCHLCQPVLTSVNHVLLQLYRNLVVFIAACYISVSLRMLAVMWSAYRYACMCVCVYLKRIDHSDRDLIKEDHDSYFIVFTDAH